jgi:hypothetical protein
MVSNVSKKLSSLLSTTLVFLLIINFFSVLGQNAYVYANTGNNISVEFYNFDRASSVGTINLRFKVYNTDNTDVNLSALKLRYYFTDDNVSPVTSLIDYASNNGLSAISNHVSCSIISINANNANKYLEYGFTSSAGLLKPGSFVELNSRLYQSNYSQNFDQNNDYSFCSQNSSYAEWNNITAYFNGALISGTEPTPGSVSTPTSTPSVFTPTPTSTTTPTIYTTPTATPEGLQKYEAEYSSLSGGAEFANDHSGYSGSGFVSGYLFNIGASTKFHINVEETAAYDVSLKYSNGIGFDQLLSVYVNGTHAFDGYFPTLSDWDSWSSITKTLTLNAGNNTIEFKRDVADGCINLDYITLVKSSQPPQTMQSSNLISNGCFTIGTLFWGIYSHSSEGADTTSSAEDNVFKMSISNPGTEPWHVGLGQAGFSLVSGKTYKISFDARSTIDRPIVVSLHNSSSYVNYFYEYTNLTNTMTNFTYYISMTVSDTSARLSFDLGSSSTLPYHDVYIDNIVVQEVIGATPQPTLAPTPTPGSGSSDLLKNGDFMDNTSYWTYQGSGYGSVVNGQYKIPISSLGTNSWDNQLSQRPIALTAGKTYRLTFEAKSTIARPIRVFICNTSNYNDYVSSDEILTMNMTDYIIEFAMTNTDSSCMLGFELGNMEGASSSDIYFDNIVLEETSGIPTYNPFPTPPVGSANLALGKSVYVSSEENGYGNIGSHAVDGNYSTRWSSGWSDNQWIYVDLGSVSFINNVKLFWESSYAKSYKVQVSNDANSWTDVYTTDLGDGGTDDITFPTTSARYVRVYGITRAIDYGFSLWEFEVYNNFFLPPSTPIVTPLPTPIIAPTSNPVNRINAALGKTATSDSSLSLSYDASKGNDDNNGSRWCAQDGNWNHWWMVDLGTIQHITGTEVVWEFGGRVYKYKIEVSNNNMFWNMAVDKTNNSITAQTQTDNFTANARYVKITVTGLENGAWASFWDFKVFVDSLFPPTSPYPPLPTATPVSSSPHPTSALPNISLVRNAALSDFEVGTTNTLNYSQAGDMTIEGVLDDDKEIVLVMDNSGAFNSYTSDIVSPFDFGIFSKEVLQIQGNEAEIKGSTYSQVLKSTGINLTITDTCASSSFFVTTPNLNINKKVNVLEPLDMPYLHPMLIAEAIACNQVYDSSSFPAGMDVPMPGQYNINIRYEPWNSRFVITGNGTFYIDKSMYFKGNLLISLPRINNTGNAFMVADGDITLQGNSLYPDDINNKVYVYSIGGNIDFQTSASTINGIAYAPGSPDRPSSSGNITFLGNGNTINGSIVGKNVYLTAGSLKVNASGNGLDAVEKKYIGDSTYLSQIKSASKNLINKFAGTKTKIGFIQYSESANNNDFIMYDMSYGTNVIMLKEKIDAISPGTSGKSNMGDGMRRADELLHDTTQTSEYSSKYLVVLTGSAPNIWTSKDSSLSNMNTDDGYAYYFGGDGTTDSNGSALMYAKIIGQKVNNSGIEAIFIDFAQENIEAKIGQISSSSGAKVIPSTGKTFYKAENILELQSIYDSIYIDTHSEITLDNVIFRELLPKGVKVVEVPENMSVQAILIGGVSRDWIIGTLNNVRLHFDGSKYILSADDFEIKVTFNELGIITFPGTDTSVTYAIDYIDSSGYLHSKNVVCYFNDLIVNVVLTRDIE